VTSRVWSRESELECPGVWVWPGVKFESLPQSPDSGHILLIDRTLSLVLCSFGQSAVLAGLKFGLYTVVHLLLEEFIIFSQVDLKYTISMSHSKS